MVATLQINLVGYEVYTNGEMLYYIVISGTDRNGIIDTDPPSIVLPHYHPDSQSNNTTINLYLGDTIILNVYNDGQYSNPHHFFILTEDNSQVTLDANSPESQGTQNGTLQWTPTHLDTYKFMAASATVLSVNVVVSPPP